MGYRSIPEQRFISCDFCGKEEDVTDDPMIYGDRTVPHKGWMRITVQHPSNTKGTKRDLDFESIAKDSAFVCATCGASFEKVFRACVNNGPDTDGDDDGFRLPLTD